MQAPTLFVLGLVAGATVVFGVRAATLEDAGPAARQETHAAHPGTPPEHGSAAPDAADVSGTAPEAAAADADVESTDARPSADPLDPDRPPENRICPVMGNPVDPAIWVDHEGRRIGFCCPGCDRVFLEEPEKYLKKVDAELRERAGGER